MSKYDLSVLIPARNEEWLAETVKNILKNKRGKTEIIVSLDGEWSNPPLPVHPDLTVIYNPKSIGQRAGTNEACKLSEAKYVMKIDAHCALDEGFDVKLMADMQDNWTMVPALYNLHVFNWRCKKCGNEWYMGAQPKQCQRQGTDGNKPEHINHDCNNTTDFEKKLVFEPRWNKRSEFYRFDTDLHFQYHGARKSHPESQGEIVETMSIQGSCFMLTREKYWELNICDEEFGSWGQQGVEVAVKTWLSGGRVVTNKKTWYSHMFRTQDGFGFPYPISGNQIQHAREYSKKLFIDNTWPLQIYPLSWLIEKFGPLEHEGKNQAPDWHTEAGRPVLELVMKNGEQFYKERDLKKAVDHVSPWLWDKEPTKGIIYYTDNQLNLKIAHACKKQIKRVGLPIVSTSLKPTDMGKNIVMEGMQRGYEAYFKQILTALENSDADIIYFCEHDWLYSPSHFEFTPEDKRTFYYNWNWWRVRSSDGHAVHYDTQMVPGLVAYRDVLIEYYRQIVKMIDDYLDPSTKTGEGYSLGDFANRIGFEPGTTKRVKFEGEFKVGKFESKDPLIDIRHTSNLTSSKWSPDAFRDPKNAQGWVENDEEIPGWGKIYGRFDEFIKSI